ncbi:MAG: sigma-54-dependent transcriptional regulator [Deferrisomatales bacterium]
MRLAKVLLIDDDDGIRYTFARIFGEENEVVTAASGEEGLGVLAERADDLDLVLLDVRMPGMDGFAVLGHIRERYPNLPVVMATAYSDTETAIRAMHLGAYDYLVKPFRVDAVETLVAAAVKQRALTRSSVRLADEDDGGSRADRIVGRTAPMLEVYKRIGQVSATDLPCLITGATGTGKELVARAVVQYSRRAGHPFLVVDCSTIPRDLMESELFGYEEGSFTGARRGGKLGKFELAQGGTLFLDEIADLPLELQAKLLRVLQAGRIQRVGSAEEVPVDVRIVAATCADLEARVADGRFRSDLYYRINVFRIDLPALAERPEDIPELVTYFARKHGAALGRKITGISEELIRAFKSREWPGNARELENAVRRALAASVGEVLTLEDAALCGPTADGDHSLGRCAVRALDELCGHAPSPYHVFLARAEAALIAEALSRSSGNVSAASRLLGITRLTLRRKAEEYGLRAED